MCVCECFYLSSKCFIADPVVRKMYIHKQYLEIMGCVLLKKQAFINNVHATDNMTESKELKFPISKYLSVTLPVVVVLLAAEAAAAVVAVEVAVEVAVIVVLGFMTLLTSQVISVAFYN